MKLNAEETALLQKPENKWLAEFLELGYLDQGHWNMEGMFVLRSKRAKLWSRNPFPTGYLRMNVNCE
jgi:hypothetical protein